MKSRSGWPLLTPLMALYGFVLFYPLMWLLYKSLASNEGLRISAYAEIAQMPVFGIVLWHSFLVALIVTVACIAIGYPVAYYVSSCGKRAGAVILVLILTPLIVGALIRSFAWLAILSNDGIVNHVLQWLGIAQKPMQLVYNKIGLYVGMINVMLPFSILPMVSVMKAIDRRLLDAAQSLGARPLETFFKVFWPLSIPGAMAGAMLTFLLSLGFYITPALLGGRKESMIAQLIQTEVMNLGAFDVAAAMSWTLMGITLVVLWLYHHFFDLNKLFGSKK